MLMHPLRLGVNIDHVATLRQALGALSPDTRAVVMLDWIWSYVTFQSGARLITGSEPNEDPVTSGPSHKQTSR